jgi:integrase/recombinase XerD
MTEQAIGRYLAELRTLGRDRRNLAHTARSLARLAAYLRERHGVADWRAVTAVQLDAFAAYLAEEYRTAEGRLVSEASRRHWLAQVRAFFGWMRERGRLLLDPAERLRLPPKSSTPRRVPSPEAIGRVIETPETTSALGLRDRAVLEVLYATGLRLSEAWGLDLYDVALEERRLLVRGGKGGRDRVVPLTEAAVYWVARYLGEARPALLFAPRRRKARQGLQTSGALWVTKAGGRLGRERITQLIARSAATAGVRASAHTFRHACATHLLRGGASVADVARLLGHTNLDTTERYTDVTIEDLERVLD